MVAEIIPHDRAGGIAHSASGRQKTKGKRQSGIDAGKCPQGHEWQAATSAAARSGPIGLWREGSFGSRRTHWAGVHFMEPIAV